VINHHFCSYKVKTQTQNFCKNAYNVTGLCNRQSCPLANSRYATIREHHGIIFLYIKSIERAHSPKNVWERVKLSKNYAQALKQIDEQLIYWPKYTIHKCKQRLTKIKQYLIRVRKLKLKTHQIKLVPIKRKLERREANREKKAEFTARLDKSIEKELLDRLQKGIYGDLYKFPVSAFEDVLEKEELTQEVDSGDLLIEELMDREFIEDSSDDDYEDDEEMEEWSFDMEDEYNEEEKEILKLDDYKELDPEGYQMEQNKAMNTDHFLSSKKKKGRRAYVEIEYEQEQEKL
jgi:protein MAK16